MVTDPLIGRLVDSRYEIVDRVARGGMATVYKAHDRRLERRVALKLMHPHLADSPDFVSRFRREARAAARLSNPGVVAVYDQGSLDGVAYLVMELVEGPNLRDLITTGPLSVKEALGLIAQVLRPLGAAHRAGLVHRDVKPENVLLPSDGSVAKVADFGLARAVTESAQTTTGNVLGTVAYLAPELITAGVSSPRADVFSAGVILYELLTGEQPFAADTPIQIAFRNVHEDVPLVSALVPEAPACVDVLVADMTRREPRERLADADEALARLRDAVAGLSPSEMSVKRGGGTGSLRTQEVLAANAEAARQAVRQEPEADDEDATPAAGFRTVSLPIGSIGAEDSGATRSLDRSTVAATDQETTSLARPRHQRVRRRTAVGLGALAVLGAGGAGGLWWYTQAGPGRHVDVPQVVGLVQEEAQAAVLAVGLVWAAPTRAYSDTVASGCVISCEPDPGSSVRLGAAVTAVVSRGIEQKQVPDVVGRTREEATTAITEAGLAVGAVTQSFSDSVPEGQVVSTSPAAGEMVDHSSAVAVVISKGRQPATVPGLAGLNEQEATTALESAGLALGEVTTSYHDTVEEGRVISSSPAAGAEDVYVGDSVALVVSLGPEMVTVPEVTGKSETEAVTALEAASLVVTVSYVWGGLFGTARSTDPAGGASVRKGSTVTLYVV
ncbi:MULTISPECIES: Stk1 family PASTA domain-containing Ser/Thr kinase [unclassified Actinomyces]|uniref:Stk1 family PASTA domain-containing Ser/Thr kinase n=1 Tax=unclassified Actinomyces TaxID=2609248 RepID=UPI0020176E26|nr:MULTISPECIES: Stk1 family PASTA domain-containing Ser/Thr kinase [unclassified Actinomyces]MCL3777567.1 serine/threonine protein kinase [Actinomyces sp. AC-20-1]MCL3790057.1 serine/threonine protein kinase [Actinomyces sp. 187325]MCL3791092.1 serine/threonine protein kinase [Actinomyces sp. 186855]MCL3794981.1 serine/threonine protein kinase [Actinomyces sp. 217892]